ncbi:MAG: DUF4982 domain-containing protein [Bacteroidales bacterium]|nr:DUF4982 domain-containing protein [Bacteroidales bacterium]
MRKAFIGLAGFLAFTLNAQQKQRLTTNWEFVKGDIGSTWEAFRPASLSPLPVWKKVALPHCFNASDAVDPDVAYYQGPGWYRTKIIVANPYINGRTLLHFEGAGQKTEVYIGSELVGRHVGGYDEFAFDITGAIARYKKESPENKGPVPIAIRCDNSRDVEMIPSDLSDFNLYGGLYRHVNLLYLPCISLKDIKVNYGFDKKNNIDISLTSLLENNHGSPEKLRIEVSLADASGKVVANANNTLQAWTGNLEIARFGLKAPKLWHPDNAYLYRMNVKVFADTLIYQENFPVGFCEVEFKEKGPLYVNGERLLLKGTHRHEDHAGLAAAMTDGLILQEMVMIKEMGVNFIRLGHYQQSRRVLELCDSLGIFVWEEIPWCRGGLGNETYKQQARRMLTNMINQHYNHVSIILWGLGNENDWPGDFPEFDKEKIRAFMSELNELAHKLDPVRKTSIRRCDFCKDIIDVYSPSIWAGWYRGVYTQYKDISYKEAMDVNHFLHVEWGADQHAGRHSEEPEKILSAIKTDGADERAGDFLMSGGEPRFSKNGDWSETYACNLIDWHLKEQETMHWLTGTAYWPFKDFSTPLRPENPVPYVNQKGVVQRDLRPKESFYIFQSYWTKKPMAHIYGHSWETRWGDEGETKTVKVFSNCNQAELFLNGRSMGIKTRNSQDYPAAGLRWEVIFNTGENHLKVLAKSGKTIVEDEIKFFYQTEKWGNPSMLKLEEYERNGDTITVCAKIYDSHGVFCPEANNLAEFETAGNARLIDNLGTSDGSRKVQLYSGRAFIKVILEPGFSTVSVKSEGIPAAIIDFQH